MAYVALARMLVQSLCSGFPDFSMPLGVGLNEEGEEVARVQSAGELGGVHFTAYLFQLFHSSPL